MSELPELKSCGVLIVRGDPIESFLLMRHPDRWDLPKGHVDPGETELDCALREMEEETGIPREAVQLDPEFRFEHRYYVTTKRSGWTRKLKSLVIFLGRLTRPMDIAVTEHSEFRWFAWSPPHHIQERTIDPLLREVEECVAKGTAFRERTL